MDFSKIKTNRSISIIIPAYNDEKTVGLVVEEAEAIAKTVTKDYEIRVIDDGSTDGTRDVVSQMMSDGAGKVWLTAHPQNIGYGGTMKELYYSAKKDLVFSCPGDGQIPPAQILRMLPALDKFDLVIGYRKERKDGIKRNIQTGIYNFMVRAMYGLGTKDINSVKLFNRKILDGIRLMSDSPFVDAELCIKAKRNGFRVGEVVIEHLPRQFKGNSGGKASIIMDTFRDLVRQRENLNG